MGHTVTTKQSVTTLARASDDISNVDPITVLVAHVKLLIELLTRMTFDSRSCTHLTFEYALAFSSNRSGQ